MSFSVSVSQSQYLKNALCRKFSVSNILYQQLMVVSWVSDLTRLYLGSRDDRQTNKIISANKFHSATLTSKINTFLELKIMLHIVIPKMSLSYLQPLATFTRIVTLKMFRITWKMMMQFFVWLVK